MARWWVGRALPWALLPWLVLLYLWGLLSGDVATATFQPIQTAGYTALMAVHAGLYRHGRRRASSSRRWSFPFYAGLQGGIVVLISAVMQPNISLPVGLSLGLMAEAIVTFPPRHAAPAVGGYALVCFLGMILADGGHVLQATALFFLGVVPLNLCLLGYVVLYQRQVSAREGTQTLLRQLETAHTELTTYAARVEDLTLLAERRRMARELHDTLAQGLAGLILQFEAVRLHLASGRIERASEIIDQAQARARIRLACGPAGYRRPARHVAQYDGPLRRRTGGTGALHRVHRDCLRGRHRAAQDAPRGPRRPGAADHQRGSDERGPPRPGPACLGAGYLRRPHRGDRRARRWRRL